MSETDQTLAELLLYTRATAAATVRPVAAKAFDSYEKALVYLRMDGNVTQVKLESLCGVPQRTISDWFGTFIRAGLASPPTRWHPNPKALYTLDELGVDLSTLKKRRKASAPTGSSETLESSTGTQTNPSTTKVVNA